MEDRRVRVGQARDLSTLAPPRHQLEGSSRFHLSPVRLESSLANSIRAPGNRKSSLDDSSRHDTIRTRAQPETRACAEPASLSR
jgi:hypothetical protein